MESQQIFAKARIADQLDQTIHLIDGVQQALRFEGPPERLQDRSIH